MIRRIASIREKWYDKPNMPVCEREPWALYTVAEIKEEIGMRDYVITTDNNSDLPDSFYQEHGVGCVYLSYTMDGVNYTHENFLPDHEFYERMRKGALPTTAQVNPASARSLMEPYLKEGKDILHIAFSSGLSGSYASSKLAAEELLEEYPERKIVVVDSLAASLGQGLLVYLAQKQKEEGKDMDTIVTWLEENRDKAVQIFTVDDLFHLHRGGRVSKTTAIVGSMLNIKPILCVDKEGKLQTQGKIRGRKKSILELVRMMGEKTGADCDTIFISHGDSEDEAKFLENKIKEKYPIKTVLMNHVGATIGAHSGPGTIALFFMGTEK